MLLQDYLLNGGTPEKLHAELGIHFRNHTEFPNLVLFKYDQIASPMGNPLVKECRGVILDRHEDWRVISRPFDKFFNHGESHAANIDWATARVQEKLDGSLATIYWYQGQWRVATSGTPDASGPVNDSGLTFSQLFWDTFKKLNLPLPNFRMVDFCFMFELMTPFNRIVVPHSTEKLVLIGVRNRFSGEEYPVENFANLYPVVRSFPLQNFDDIFNTFQTMDPIKQEGYVVVDGRFRRVKVKHPGYVAIHHLKGDQGPTPKRMLEVARTGEGSEVLTHFPEWKPLYDEVKAKFEGLIVDLEADFDRINKAVEAAIPPGVIVNPSWTQKEFAMHAVKTRCPDALFRLRSKQAESIRKYLIEMDLRKLADLLKLRDDN